MTVLRSGEVGIAFTPNDTVIPDLECASSFNLAHNAISCTDRMMSGLKDSRDLLGNSNGKDKEI